MIPASLAPYYVLRACPSFVQVLLDPRRDVWPDGAVFFDSLARHVVLLIKRNKLSELPAVFALADALILHGTEQVGDDVVFYFLEGLWDESERQGVAWERVEEWLGASASRWMAILRSVMGWQVHASIGLTEE